MVTVLPPGELEPSSFGLVNSKTLVSDNERWLGGFDQESTACMADVDLIDVCRSDFSERVIDAEGTGTNGEYLPFGVQATVKCSTAGGLRTDWEARARLALEQCHRKAVELEFWEGKIVRAGNTDEPGSYPNRYLANGDADDITPQAGTAVKVRYGLALLEGKLADLGCGGRGFIHMPRSIASVLPVKPDGDVLKTTLGNYVIAGDGYSGRGTNGVMPSGAARWIFATGPVSVRLSDIDTPADYPKQNINTATNQIEVSADRTAAVTWDGCVHIGVLVDLSLDYA